MSEHYCMYKDGMCELDIDEAYQQGRADAIDECISVIDDIYNNDKHCILDECKSSNNCSDCLYLVISNKLEQLKEQK